MLYPSRRALHIQWIGWIGLRIDLGTVQKEEISCPCKEPTAYSFVIKLIAQSI
jgi:hypothetical protein